MALKALPEKVVAASAERGVPVFFYEGRYMERVIADLMNALDDDAAEWERNHLIDERLVVQGAHAHHLAGCGPLAGRRKPNAIESPHIHDVADARPRHRRRLGAGRCGQPVL